MSKVVKFAAIAMLLLLLALPVTGANAAIGGPYTVGVTVQNLSNSTANIVLQFYSQDGSSGGTFSDTIGANANKAYFPLPSVNTGFNGSLVVSSDQQVAAIGNVIYPDLTGTTAYGSFSAGATTVNLPLMMKGNVGYLDTWFNVQNTTSTATTVNVAYKPGSCTESVSVPAFSSKTVDQSANSCLPAGFVGAASLTAPQPIVAVVVEIQRAGANGPYPRQLSSYNGFTSANPVLVMPIVTSNFYGTGTGIALQNTGASDTDVTLSYTPSGGSFPGAACTEKKTVAAGQFQNFGFPQLPAGCGTQGTGVSDPVNGGFVGSAKVAANSANMPLVGIVNQVNRTNASADAYDAVNPANATSKVSMPLIMDRNVGFFSGISIANLGAQPTNISCTFTNTSFTVSANNVQPGAALTDAFLNKIADKYVGSGTCTASGGDAKIAGIVNQLLTGVPTTTDGFSDYGAFNY